MADTIAFEQLVADHRNELYAHCYRMLGSVQDAEDALQEALLGAWRGLSGFEGRSSVRAWLYRICTNACLRVIERRPRRVLSAEYGPPRTDLYDLGTPVEGPVFVEPWLGELPAAEADPAVRYQRRESVELAFVAALQHLPGTQRAVLILREVLGFSAAETASMLDTTAASVNSALQRARATVDERIPDVSQAAELDALGEDGRRELVDAFVSAWERADVDGITRLLAQDARFTMPPLPAWFEGRDAVMRFVAGRNFETPWRLVSLRPSGTPAFACYQSVDGGPFTLGAVMTLILRDGLVSEIASFLDPALYRHLGLPAHL
jgi:RNA polymerase sigma-70 factor (TIGR02960 family)